MPMLTRLRGTVLTVAVAATVFSLGAGPAFAASYTVTPGGNVTGAAGTTTLKDTTSGTTVNCTSSSASGSLQSGNGTPLGSISSISFTNCTGPFGITFSASVTGPFPVNATGYSGGVTSGTITHIHGALTSSLCSLTIDGTSGSANNGTVNATFTNSTDTLKVLTTGSTLHIYNVSGCFGFVKNGDSATFTGSYKITPTTTITSP